MKLVYYSSVLNHHQKCLCDEFYKYYGNEFLFITTMEMEQQRLNLGYKPETAPYLFEGFRSDESKKKAFQLAVECDVLIAAVFPEEILHERMRRNKLTFRHIETYFKREKYRLLSPNAMKIAYTQHTKYRKKPLFLLCASSHVASDVNLFAAYPGKKYRWGYFPELGQANALNKSASNSKITLLWAGRFITWKKPDYALRVIADLREKGYPVCLEMIGTGPMEESLKEYVKNRKLENDVIFCGAMPPKEVRMHMQQADIYLFTSTREEGWGAVLNEAMDSGCAVVASSEAGSTDYLVKHNQNGLVYRHNSLPELISCVTQLCADQELRERLSGYAKQTVENEWNYKTAASRFIEVSELLLAGNSANIYEDGPMSRG